MTIPEIIVAINTRITSKTSASSISRYDVGDIMEALAENIDLGDTWKKVLLTGDISFNTGHVLIGLEESNDLGIFQVAGDMWIDNFIIGGTGLPWLRLNDIDGAQIGFDEKYLKVTDAYIYTNTTIFVEDKIRIGGLADTGDKLQVTGDAFIDGNLYFGKSQLIDGDDFFDIRASGDSFRFITQDGANRIMQLAPGDYRYYDTDFDNYIKISPDLSRVSGILGLAYIDFYNPSTGCLDIVNTEDQPIRMLTDNTERLRVTATGSVLINTSVDNGLGLLQVAGNISLSNGGTTGGFIYGDTTNPFISLSSNTGTRIGYADSAFEIGTSGFNLTGNLGHGLKPYWIYRASFGLRISDVAATGATDPYSDSFSAMLKLDSTTRGFIPPCMTEDQRDDIEFQTEGLIVFNTDTKKLNLFDGTAWTEL